MHIPTQIGHVHTLELFAEGWHILSPGEVYLGVKRHVDAEELLRLVEKLDIETMLDLMHRVPANQHQTVYVAPGRLHAIGEEIMVAEVQEPEDQSFLLEWHDLEIDGREHGHVGLEFEKVLDTVETRLMTEKGDRWLGGRHDYHWERTRVGI